MIFSKKMAAAIAITMLVGSVPAAAETGYIRIGDKCFVVIGGPGGSFLMEIPCPREVSENP